mgnify:CR=1 FL=1
MRRTRQSLPPLYESDISSKLNYGTRVSKYFNTEQQNFKDIA